MFSTTFVTACFALKCVEKSNRPKTERVSTSESPLKVSTGVGMKKPWGSYLLTIPNNLLKIRITCKLVKHGEPPLAIGLLKEKNFKMVKIKLKKYFVEKLLSYSIEEFIVKLLMCKLLIF